MAYENFFEKVTNQIELHDKLKEKCSNHDNLSLYTDFQGLKGIINDGFRLSNGFNWNDEVDKENLSFGDENERSKHTRFCISFTYSKTENISMWMLYSCIEGGNIKIKNRDFKKIMDLLDALEIKDRNKTTVMKLKKEDYECELIDVVYVGSGDVLENIAFKKSIYGKNDNPKKNFNYDIDNNNLNYYSKKYGWAYENECRFIITIKDNVDTSALSNDECYYIYLDYNIVNYKDKLTVMLHPNNYVDLNVISNNILIDKDSIEYSKYKNEVKWNIKECKKCQQ